MPTDQLRTRPAVHVAPFVENLAVHGERVAVITGDGELTYRELAERVDAVAMRLRTARRLVLVSGANELEPLVTYLGAVAAGSPVVLAGDTSRSLDSLVAAYDPDVVAGTVGGEWMLDERRDETVHDLHPDLALLLSTSGSTGSPKLVRLSHRNLQANAQSIAAYLDIRQTDRAATTLPMYYCYGLSVIHSHLLTGAGLILTDLSVVDACFWDLFKDAGGTTFAGVPHTFDLLDRVGFTRMRLPRLRYVTQAGGRLAPDRVRRYAELGRQRGWALFVMYGQTEATARMAYVPPEVAAAHPSTIGVPIPGGTFTLEPVEQDASDVSPREVSDVGELVYRGPNVMLGYAESPADLGLGRTVEALRTGDLARRTSDGLYEIVGRRSRFVKIVGQRIDLQRVEAMLAEHGVAACCADVDDELAIVVKDVTGAVDVADVERRVATDCGLPRAAIHVRAVSELPRLATGKLDYQAVRDLVRHAPVITDAHAPLTGSEAIAGPTELCALYAELLDRPDAGPDDTFVSLGGDSLSYVEMSVRLEQALGTLPPNWHTTSIHNLARTPRRFRLRVTRTDGRRRRGLRTVETSVSLRAIAIILIVGSHAGLYTVQGSAHLLLAVAGFNFARFQLTSAERWERFRHQAASIARIVVPSVVWIGAAVVVADTYGLANVFLLNGLVGPDSWTSTWHFWFIEVLVYLLIVMMTMLAIPWVDRMERRAPFAVVLVVLAPGLVTRFGVVELGIPHTMPALWLFALGWAIARASMVWHRLLLTVVIVAAVPGFFDDLWREAVMVGGMVLLLWARGIVCPAPLHRIVGVLASSSLYIYLTHWQIYPLLADDQQRVAGVAALLASLAVGISYWLLATRVMKWVTASLRGRYTGAPNRWKTVRSGTG